MADNLSEIALDFTVKEQFNIPYKFVEYCEGAFLMLKDKDTIALYSVKEFEKLMEKARSTGSNAIMRYFLALLWKSVHLKICRMHFLIMLHIFGITLGSLSNLAATYSELGDYGKSLELYEKLYPIDCVVKSRRFLCE